MVLIVMPLWEWRVESMAVCIALDFAVCSDLIAG